MRFFQITFTSFLIVHLLILSSCGNTIDPKTGFQEEKQLIAYISPSEKMAWINEGYSDAFSSSPYITNSDDQVNFKMGTETFLIKTEMLNVTDPKINLFEWLEGEKFVLDSFVIKTEIENPYDSIIQYEYRFFRLWGNASCGKFFPAVPKQCIGTFGPDTVQGRSLEWQIAQHYTCETGKGYCLEELSIIGYKSYHRTVNCSDPLPRFFNLNKYICK